MRGYPASLKKLTDLIRITKQPDLAFLAITFYEPRLLGFNEASLHHHLTLGRD